MEHHNFIMNFPVQPQVFQSWVTELNRGYAYIYKRDRAFRPIFHINVNKLKKIKTDPEILISMSTYII